MSRPLVFTIAAIILALLIAGCVQPVISPTPAMATPEPTQETAVQEEAQVVEPPPMDDPSLLPIEQFQMSVDDLPVDVDVFREGWGKTYAAGVALDPAMPPSNHGFPPFVFVDFTSPLSEVFPDPKAIFTMDVAQGRIFPVAPYLAMYQEAGRDYAQDAVTGLQQVLAERPVTLDEKLLTLPGFGDAQQGVRGTPTYIDFKGGSGVSFVAGYGQEIGPLLNDTLVYQFVGLTDTHRDTPFGTQYISFAFPLEANFLHDLDSVTEEEIAAAEADLTSYLAGVTEQIANAADSDFEPDLSALKAAMQSIVIGPSESQQSSEEEGSEVVVEASDFPIPEPEYNTKLVRDFTSFQEALDGFSPERAEEMHALLSGKTILDIQEMMESGEMTAVELVIYYAARTQQYDIDKLNSVMELNPDALEIAAKLDEERAAGTVRGAMHGIPVLLKANIATGDQMKTTAGAVAMQDWRPERDAFLVQQLRNAGAIILGKANLSEWANYMDPTLPNGFSALGGQTRAAYGPYDPLGSSTGSAVSVAANLATVSVGTETQGSIILPSTVNGVVGLKTSRGLVSRDHVIPLVDWMDVPGPVGRNVTDVAVMLTAMTGTDENDPATQDAAELAGTDFTKFLSLEEAQKIRVGFIGLAEEALQQMVDASSETELIPEEADAVRASLMDIFGDPQEITAILTEQGIETVFIDFQEETKAASENAQVLEYGFQDSFNRFMATLGDSAPYASLADVVAFNNEDLANRAPYGQAYVEGSANTTIGAEEYEALKQGNMQNGVDMLRSLFERYDVDIIMFRIFTQEYAPAGFPALTVPDGIDSGGVPVSMVLVGDYLSEPQLIAVGYAYEQGIPALAEPNLEARMEEIAPVVP